jgi:di/tricarboxylate transporter
VSSEAWFTLVVTAVVLYLLAKEIAPTDMVFMAAIVLLSVLGILQPADAFGGFVNNAVLMVAGLLVVAAGLRETGVMDAIGHKFLSQIKT